MEMKYKQQFKLVIAFLLLFFIVLSPIQTHALVAPVAGGGGSGSGGSGSGGCGLSVANNDCGTENSDQAAKCSGTSCGGSGGADCISKSGGDIVSCYVNPAIDLFSGLVGVVVVISIIIGGIQYSSSAGDPQKAARAKGRIINAIIALIAFAFLYGFLEFIIPGGAFQ
jgi:hypothetical protein